MFHVFFSANKASMPSSLIALVASLNASSAVSKYMPEL
jgi:hypothetical protein